MLPTNFFKGPDIISLSSGDIRRNLIKLVLIADSEGQGHAHAMLLDRELDYPPEQVESALVERECKELVHCYQIGKHRYYSLCR